MWRSEVRTQYNPSCGVLLTRRIGNEMHWVCTGIISAIVAFNVSLAAAESQALVDVKRELYAKHPKKGTAINVSVCYVGPGLEREEIHSWEAVSDEPERPMRRRSRDNGRTWSELEPIADIVSKVGEYMVYWGCGPMFYDADAGVTASIWLRQTYKGPVYMNQCFYRLSRDNAMTWFEAKQLRYEDGPVFNPSDPANAEFLKRNRAYLGNNIIRHSNGTLIHCVAAANVPYENKQGASYHPWVPADAKDIGSLCFVGKWNRETNDYGWTAGKPVWVPLEVSSRGLMEPDVVELKDGRVLVVWRGSDTPVTEGRKWFSVSDDGGRTLSAVQELKYDDGSRFYSPSSIHRFIRHSITKKLYWVGNICAAPPRGNMPRYPLIIAEVDEAIPALKRNTVTVIDDRAPEEGPDVQLSNFSLFEDRETHHLELYLIKFAADPKDVWQSADAFKYVLTLRPDPQSPSAP